MREVYFVLQELHCSTQEIEVRSQSVATIEHWISSKFNGNQLLTDQSTKLTKPYIILHIRNHEFYVVMMLCQF